MRTAKSILPALAGAAVLLLAPLAGSASPLPYAESFETYTNGHPIGLVAGWSADTNVLVSTNAMAVGALTNSALFPLGGPHAKVLQVGGAATNSLTGSTGGVTVLDLLVMPARRRRVPSDDTMQMAVCVSTNGRLTVWHQNTTNTPVNEWRELANSPVLPTDVWARVTVRLDQSNALYQVSVNGGSPLVDDTGWTSNNGARPGSWFHMVQTNRAMASVALGGEIVSYLDDLVVTNRGLSLSTNEFREATANDGTIDNAAPMTVVLKWDTFAATNNENLAADPGKLWVTNLPPGLAVSARVTAPTQLTVTLTGQANNHEAENGVSNLTFAFGGAAFASGRAWDVAGSSITNLAVRFQSSATPVLTYDTTLFTERAANDGGVGGSAALLLTTKDFAGADTEDFVTSGRVTSSNLPAGLTASVIRTGARAATLTFTGRSAAHAASNSLANLNITFRTNAFADGVAATVSNAVRSDLQIAFLDPPAVSYGGASFAETAANGGAVTNALTVALVGDTFTNAAFVRDTHFSASHVPAGLTPAVAYVNPTQVVVSLSGTASPHDSGANATIGFAFLNGAFQTVAASNIVGATQTFAVTFLDPPVVTAAPAGFSEAAANDGTIGNNVTLSLTGTTFAAGPFSAGVHYTVSGVPSGLSFDLVRNSDTQLVASLANAAASHAAADNTNLVVTLLTPAFQTVAASNITGSAQTLGVTFQDPLVLSYAPLAFTERGDDVGAMGNTVAISLSGARFAAGALQEGAAYTVAGVPPGLSFALARNSDTSVTASLGGQATTHSNANDTVVCLSFLDAAFQSASVSNILGAVTNLAVDFIDLPPANAVPFTDAFEAYPNGFWVVGTNGWNDAAPDAGIVTNAPERVGDELAYGGLYPLNATHAQILQVNAGILSRTRSTAGRPVVVDCMTYVQGRAEAPGITTNDQMGLYVDTNQCVTVWRRDPVAGTNLWTTLTGTCVTTGAWHRVTVCLDYGHSLFKVRVDGQTLSDAAGWSGPGGTHPGPWFNIGQQNGYLSSVTFGGGKSGRPVHIDDVSLSYEDPFGQGAVFKLR